jgi:hypothetical protein
MRCPRTREIDWAAYQAEPTADAWAEVRAHYPTCPDCSREVERLTRMRLALAETEPPAHPSEEELLAYDREPARLTARRQDQIERHVSGCRRCRNELAVLEAMMPVRVASAAPEADGAKRDGLLSRLLALLTSGPALAAVGTVALIVIGLLVALGREEPAGRDAPALVASEEPKAPSDAGSGDARARSPEQLASEGPEPARDEVTPESSEPLPGGPPDTTPGRVEQLAEQATQPPDEREAPIVPDAAEASQRPPVELAETTPEGAATGPVEGRRSEGPATDALSNPEAEAPREEMLLAALDDLPPPAFALPPGARVQAWLDQYGPIRSGAGGETIEALAPIDHVGLTLERSPHLWWRLDAPTDRGIQITIADEEAIEPVLRTVLPGPHGEGLHDVDLAALGVKLEPGIEYRWFVALLVDPERPSRNPTSAGAIRVLAAEDDRRQAIARAAPHARGHTLAELGIWYDAFDFFAALARQNPDAEWLAEDRDRLVERNRPAP